MIIINLLGLLLIGLIVWWFWLYKAKEVTADEGVISIKVENGTYEPSRIRIQAGKPTTLRFLRKDASPCAATVVFADFDISEELPLNKNKDVYLPPGSPGEYSFTCQMQMYRGTLVIIDKK
ncbi:plastocyanin [Vibrio natriegens]|uniref:cupredoxin domain-containing protein n=1 Tax=Vibrio natriegens TaxID=691 RepID=UPI000803FB73|nr:cupredoxin domain-containing protein [Vibrio natriegens]ANQ22381.1 plastocyanin [Vibrio natriegens]